MASSSAASAFWRCRFEHGLQFGRAKVVHVQIVPEGHGFHDLALDAGVVGGIGRGLPVEAAELDRQNARQLGDALRAGPEAVAARQFGVLFNLARQAEQNALRNVVDVIVVGTGTDATTTATCTATRSPLNVAHELAVQILFGHGRFLRHVPARERFRQLHAKQFINLVVALFAQHRQQAAVEFFGVLLHGMALRRQLGKLRPDHLDGLHERGGRQRVRLAIQALVGLRQRLGQKLVGGIVGIGSPRLL